MLENKESIIRINKVRLKNFKNVKNGEISLDAKNNEFETTNILGVYGQNGSGKSALVEALEIVMILLMDDPLSDDVKDYIYIGEDTATIAVDFLIYDDNLKQKYDVFYTVEISKTISVDGFIDSSDIIGDINKNKLPDIVISKESLKYKPHFKGSRPSTIIEYNIKNNETIFTPIGMYTKLTPTNEDKLNIMLAERTSKFEKRSFIFNVIMHKNYSKYIVAEPKLAIEKMLLLFILKKYAVNDLHVVDEKLTLIGTHTPFIIQLNEDIKKNTEIFTDLNKKNENIISKAKLEKLEDIIENINIVLSSIIIDLSISIKQLSSFIIGDEEKVEIEFYANREEQSIPLEYESQGVKKIISLMGYLIYVYNNESACLVVDELDSAIFEYLLGEILMVFKESAKGQLIFTSHNLRALEVLDSNEVVFTTVNKENRYIKFKNVKKDNNLRSMYYTAIQLGGQQEEVYNSTKAYNIRRAFRKAGDLNG